MFKYWGLINDFVFSMFILIKCLNVHYFYSYNSKDSEEKVGEEWVLI